MARKIQGTIILQPMGQSTTAETLLEIENWLNDVVAIEAYSKYRVGLRVHIDGKSLEQALSK